MLAQWKVGPAVDGAAAGAVLARHAAGRWRSADDAARAADEESTDRCRRVHDMELLRSAAAKPAALSTRGHLRDDQVVQAVPTGRPKRVRARLAEEQDLRAYALQL